MVESKQRVFMLIVLLWVTPTHSSFLRSIIEDIQALNEYNRINRQTFFNLNALDLSLGTQIEQIENKTFTFADLAGAIPEDIKEVVTYIKNIEDYENVGATMPQGILLYGPGGTGKTSIARAIAGESNAAFFHASGSDFVEMYVGVGPQRVRELFNQAKRSLSQGYERAIIFIDEIDAIGASREAEQNSEYRNTLNELLNQMDGFSSDNRIFILAATNQPRMLDKALLRPGRFDRLIEVPLPNYESRLSILHHYIDKIKYDDDTSTIAEIALITENFNNAELKSLVNESAVLAARHKQKNVTAQHLKNAFEKVARQKNLR